MPCVQTTTSSANTGFEVTSKRRKGYPSETRVKRGHRVVNGDKELLEKLGRNDPCPCGSGLRFQALLHADRRARRFRPGPLLLGNECFA
ncbi:MAG: SEC-C domain-containing protein [Burkholderiaceae bacterium]|nr:SEC-C domain-containing protein [Burkholderiaceae bacterium]